MLKEIYGDSDNIMIYGLPDLTNENDIRPEWGSYLLEKIDRYIYKKPELMVYGNDESRSAWFSKDDLSNLWILLFLVLGIQLLIMVHVVSKIVSHNAIQKNVIEYVLKCRECNLIP